MGGEWDDLDVAEELSGFHAWTLPSELLREEMQPIFLVGRRSMGEDAALLIKESPGSFLPMLNTPGRT